MEKLAADGFIGTYIAKGDFLVDVFLKDDVFDAWLYRKNFGTKNSMFGIPVNQTINGKAITYTLDDYLDMIEGAVDEYIEYYIEDVSPEMISLAEWAESHGISPDTARQRALRGCFKSAVKIGRNWVIDVHEPLVDGRKKN